MSSYKIGDTISSDQVPDWERRPAKWSELVDAVFDLEPGQTITIHFDNAKEAERARNAVRDQANLIAKSVICRTRLIKRDEDKADLYLTRVHQSEAAE